MSMNRNDAHSTLQNIFRDVFDDDGLVITDEMTRESFPTWDSLGHIRLVSAMEEAFAVSYTIEEIEGMTSVGRILDVVTAKS